MIPSLLQSFAAVTDPARLQAELWADSVLKVVSCWLPVLMSTVLVGRDLLGSSTQCFPMDLVHGTVQPENNTSVSKGNSSDKFSEISVYSRQLSEFVNVYCAGGDPSSTNPTFSYNQFALMLVIQAALMYAPFLVWNVTIGREVVCNVRFIAHDMVVLYDRFRKKDVDETKERVANEQQNAPADGQAQGGDPPPQTQGKKSPYEQEELVEAEKKWRQNRAVYICYLVKQALSVSCAVAFITAYSSHPPISVGSIEEKFQCSVENKFSVTCTVPAAAVHRYVWWTNMVLLSVSVILIVIHIVMLHARAEDQPFAEIGIKDKKGQTEQGERQDQDRGRDRERDRGQDGRQEGGQERREDGGRTEDQPVAATGSDDENTSFVTAQSQITILAQDSERRRKCWSPLNDSHMMHSFFKANIESVEKYKYVKSLLKVLRKLSKDEQRPTA